MMVHSLGDRAKAAAGRVGQVWLNALLVAGLAIALTFIMQPELRVTIGGITYQVERITNPKG